MARHAKKSYTEEFRRNAVTLADQPDRTAADVAQELGISPNQIYNWRNQFKRLSEKQFNTVDGVTYGKGDSDEVRRLKRELARVTEERDFLKKAAAYFANEPQ